MRHQFKIETPQCKQYRANHTIILVAVLKKHLQFFFSMHSGGLDKNAVVDCYSISVFLWRCWVPGWYEDQTVQIRKQNFILQECGEKIIKIQMRFHFHSKTVFVLLAFLFCFVLVVSLHCVSNELVPVPFAHSACHATNGKDNVSSRAPLYPTNSEIVIFMWTGISLLGNSWMVNYTWRRRCY